MEGDKTHEYKYIAMYIMNYDGKQYGINVSCILEQTNTHSHSYDLPLPNSLNTWVLLKLSNLNDLSGEEKLLSF